MAEKSQFKRDKFKKVVHFICSKVDKEDLGNVKLHKILYFADMLSFLAHNEPLTGVEYQKQKFGPVAKHLTWAVNELASEGSIRIQKRDYYGYAKTDYIAVSQPDTNGLTNQEVALLSDVIDFICSRSAREISELSHDAAWHKARLGEIIPYAAAYGLIPAKLSESDVSAAMNEARSIRRHIDENRPRC